MHPILLLSVCFLFFQLTPQRKSPKDWVYPVIGWKIDREALGSMASLSEGSNHSPDETNRVKSDEKTHRYPLTLLHIDQKFQSNKSLPAPEAGIPSCPYKENE